MPPWCVCPSHQDYTHAARHSIFARDYVCIGIIRVGFPGVWQGGRAPRKHFSHCTPLEKGMTTILHAGGVLLPAPPKLFLDRQGEVPAIRLTCTRPPHCTPQKKESNVNGERKQGDQACAVVVSAGGSPQDLALSQPGWAWCTCMREKRSQITPCHALSELRWTIISFWEKHDWSQQKQLKEGKRGKGSVVNL